MDPHLHLGADDHPAAWTVVVWVGAHTLPYPLTARETATQDIKAWGEGEDTNMSVLFISIWGAGSIYIQTICPTTSLTL